MRFKSIRLPDAQQSGGGGMSIIGGIGIALAKELIPNLFQRAARGRGDVVERVANGVADVVMDATGLSQDADPDQVIGVLKSDPIAYARVQEAAAQVAIAEINANMELGRQVVEDRASARDMYTTSKSRTSDILAGVAALFAFAALAGVVFLDARDIEPSTLTVTIVTAAIGFFATVIAFHFGSSAGSKAKTEVLNDLSTKR